MSERQDHPEDPHGLPDIAELRAQIAAARRAIGDAAAHLRREVPRAFGEGTGPRPAAATRED